MEPILVELANSLVWWAGSIEALGALSFCLDLECFDCKRVMLIPFVLEDTDMNVYL